MPAEFLPVKPSPAPPVLSVGELNRTVAGFLERSFPLLWVSGEISNLTRASSGHWYFSLKDADAQVRCVMFRNRNRLVDWSPREGDRVEARALVTLYVPRGDFQLGIEDLRKAGSGTLFEAFLRLKARLEAEGLFAADKKRPIPAFPHTIGIITSPKAAALRDVLTTFARRAPHIRLIVYPTPVQGADAPAGVIKSIKAATRPGAPACDVLLVVRGGGSIEDLWAFNDEGVARAIAASPVPVISGVGHETDFTIADFVADARAPTPTAAAELASPDGVRLKNELQRYASGLRRSMQRRLDVAEQRLDSVSIRLKSPAQRVAEMAAQVRNLVRRMARAAQLRNGQMQQRLTHVATRLVRAKPDPAAASNRTAALAGRLASAWQVSQTTRRNRLELLSARLELLNPASALARGYALATDENGRIIRHAADVQVGALLHVQFASGSAQARVETLDTLPARS